MIFQNNPIVTQIMKQTLILIMLIALYIFFEVGRFWYKYTHLPILENYQHTDLTLGQGTELRYIAAGDSSAVGVGASLMANGYTNKIATELAKTHSVTYKNIAVTGSKTQQVLDKQLQQIIDFNPEIVTISIGGNDATHLISSATILENNKKIIHELTTKTSAKIYFATIPNFHWATVLPWFYRQLIEYKNSGINREIMKLETDRVKIVNIHDFGWSNYPDISQTNAADSFHPSDLGYQNWTDAFLSKIKGK